MTQALPGHSRNSTDQMLRDAQAALHFAHTLNHYSALERILSRHSHYDPNQPRVPAGHPDGGQWTRVGGVASSNREVVSDAIPDNEWILGAQYATGRGGRGPRPPMEFGQAMHLAVAQARARDAVALVRELDPNWRPTQSAWSTTPSVEGQIRAYEAEAQQALGRLAELFRSGASSNFPGYARDLNRVANEAAIEAYRSDRGLFDLFGHKVGYVAVTKVDGKYFFGTNSDSDAYTPGDWAAAKNIRTLLTEIYPELKTPADLGQKLTDAIFHAETTVLIRAARENGGTLAGRTLEVEVDARLCNSCREMLPKIALQLGNPTVKFTDRIGQRLTVRDGRVLPEK
jgi:hypothetical protein